MSENGPPDPPGQQGPPQVTRPMPSENKTRIPRPMVCKVLLLNGEEYEVAIDKRAIGQLLYERVCDYVDLLERDYFGLLFKNDEADGSKYWLDPNKKITKQKKRGKMEFEFALKFYPPDPTQLTESITRYLVCLQIRRDIISGKLPCSLATHAMLGSYAVQADIGDYDPIDHGSGIDYIRDTPFAPDQNDELLYKIATLHKQHKGQTPEDAEMHYLEYAKKIALYGIDVHKAKDSDYVDILLGVGATGISVYRDNLRINRFVWPKILKISYRRNKFLLRIRPAEFETYESWIAFRLPSNKMAKRIWKIAVEHHAFLRLRSADDAKKRTGFPRFGSKYRYSGRTLHQTRVNASIADRPSKQFERAHSNRSLNSVLNNNRTRSQDNLNHRAPYRDMHNMSFDTYNEPRNRAPVVPVDRLQEGRTPLQSPLPKQESPKFTHRDIIRHEVREEHNDSFEAKLPSVPTESPRGSPKQARPKSNHEAMGGVRTPLATIVSQESVDEGLEGGYQLDDISPKGSLDSIDLQDEEDARSKSKKNPPDVAPKPGKEKPPVAKKPEKPQKPEKPAKAEKPPKAPKPSKKEKEAAKKAKKDKKSPEKGEKVPMTEVTL